MPNAYSSAPSPPERGIRAQQDWDDFLAGYPSRTPAEDDARNQAYWKTYRDMVANTMVYGPPPMFIGPLASWIEDVATRLRSALFATAQGWDWEWDRPGIYTRLDTDDVDVRTGTELVMRLLGVLAPHTAFLVDVGEPVPFWPTEAADALGIGR